MPKREIISHDSEDRFLSGVVSIQDQDITDRSWKVYAQVYKVRKKEGNKEERDIDRQREGDIGYREREIETERQIKTQTERKTERERQTDRQIDRQIDRETDRDIQTERERERERKKRERERDGQRVKKE